MQNVSIEIKRTLLLSPSPPSSAHSLSLTCKNTHTNLNNWIRWYGLLETRRERERE